MAGMKGSENLGNVAYYGPSALGRDDGRLILLLMCILISLDCHVLAASLEP
jgi:hypothetical protein